MKSLFSILILLLMANISFLDANNLTLNSVIVAVTPTPEATVPGFLDEYMCELPCFLGLIPGQTSYEDSVEFILDNFPNAPQFHFVPRNNTDTYEFYIHDIALHGQFVEEEGNLAIVAIQIFSEDASTAEAFVPAWSLRNILANSETAPTIYIYIRETGIWGVTLLYEEIGLAIRYSYFFSEGEYEYGSSDPILLCPSVDVSYFINIWIYDLETELAETFQVPQNIALQDSKFDVPLDFVAEITVEDFISTLLDDDHGCIEALSYMELKEKGYRF